MLEIKSWYLTWGGPISWTEVGNWTKKNNALALEIVSLKCNALVIMH